MIRLSYGEAETTLEWDELLQILQRSDLPWFNVGTSTHPEIFVVGPTEDLVLRGEMV
jgi:hypothetical protein